MGMLINDYLIIDTDTIVVAYKFDGREHYDGMYLISIIVAVGPKDDTHSSAISFPSASSRDETFKMLVEIMSQEERYEGGILDEDEDL